jgi:geranylgeranyl reductase
VRDDAEVNAMLAVSTIKGGIKVRGQKAAPSASPAAENDEREPALAGKG